MPRKPRPLAKGSSVRILAPSSPFERARLPEGLKVLTDMGLVPLHSERVFQDDGYLAGPDALRLHEMVAAFTAEPGDAVIPARGGYGAMRLLRELASRAGALQPRLFLGFSDITALHLFFRAEADLVTFHGPNVISMAHLDQPSLARLQAALFGRDPAATFLYAGLRPLTSGRARGRIVAGNLSLITSLIGTRWAAPLRGAILVLEDVSEPLYRVDRMLTQVSLQAGFEGVAGLAFGDLGVEEAERERLAVLLSDFARAAGKPAVTGFPVGHGACNFPVPQGVEALLDADIGVLRVLESPYEGA